MEQYYYSASQSKLFPKSLFEDYRSTGLWPDDAEPVSDDIYQEFGANPAPVGKIMVTGEDGLPAWGDLPAPSLEELIAIAEAKKSSLLAAASAAIAPLQDAVDIEIATDEEIAQLLVWKKYRVLLNRVDTSTAPDIAWPEAPENVA
ncbi:tail fiber assembly protein [Erwinia sp. HR93]|uniref:tail fiber assembly protein n=1 Tax=Erwinia sp. HR93 TaxID=3094840 RepID=UPI002ADEBD2B|nr:tail fiber assembly protein [Erwinia sp. HR93]MEA1062774.1 tail fiber assembly protein [Erwinia sp. HR93]